MNRNLYLVIAALVGGVAVLGYQLYQERKAPAVEITIGPGGISIEEN
jgi:hypothetical protein